MLPLQMLLACLLGWLEAEQRDVITFLREENRVLRAQLGRRRLRLDDDQRRRLAVLGHRLGRALMREVATLVTPDTILRWHRELIARKNGPTHGSTQVVQVCAGRSGAWCSGWRPRIRAGDTRASKER